MFGPLNVWKRQTSLTISSTHISDGANRTYFHESYDRDLCIDALPHDEGAEAAATAHNKALAARLRPQLCLIMNI